MKIDEQKQQVWNCWKVQNSKFGILAKIQLQQLKGFLIWAVLSRFGDKHVFDENLTNAPLANGQLGNKPSILVRSNGKQ